MSAMKTPNPDYAERLRASFARQGLMTTLGAELGEIGPGACDVVLPYSERVTQQHGFFHGGAIGAIADVACGYAGFTLVDVGSTMLTVEYKLNLVAPGRGERLIARGRVLRPGRSLCVVEGRVYGVIDGAEKLCAVSLQTMMRIDQPADGSMPD